MSDPVPQPVTSSEEGQQASSPGLRPAGEVMLAAALIGLWSMVWLLTTDFPPQSVGYVRFILSGLFLFSGAHLLTALVQWVRTPRRAAPAAPARRPRERAWLTAAFIGSSLLFVLLIPVLGLLTATLLFGLPWLGKATAWDWRPLAVITVLVVALYLLASVVLGLRMPDGLLI